MLILFLPIRNNFNKKTNFFLTMIGGPSVSIAMSLWAFCADLVPCNFIITIRLFVLKAVLHSMIELILLYTVIYLELF